MCGDDGEEKDGVTTVMMMMMMMWLMVMTKYEDDGLDSGLLGNVKSTMFTS